MSLNGKHTQGGIPSRRLRGGRLLANKLQDITCLVPLSSALQTLKHNGGVSSGFSTETVFFFIIGGLYILTLTQVWI